MTDIAQDRVAKRPVDKFAERRDQLADAALHTLSELGYARTSLREIANNSDFSHGVLHYYFTDKVDLITYCVRRYKAACVERYDLVVSTAETADALTAGFATGMATTLVDDATMHRLWYDLRSQSQFEPAFRADVAEIDGSLERMIWRMVEAYAALTGSRCVVSPASAYAAFDGLFQHALLRELAGDELAATELTAGIESLLPRIMTPPPSA